jgi:hypothetical protein
MPAPTTPVPVTDELTMKLLPLPDRQLRLVVWENEQVIDILETAGDDDTRNERLILNHMLHLAYVKGLVKQEYRVRPKG